MLKVSADGSIELTRGDTARFNVSISNEITGEAYTPESGDELMLTIRKSVTDAEPMFQQTIEPGGSFHIEPEDTSGWEFGKYLYDVQLTTAMGDVYTVIGPAGFKIAKEVGF